MGRSSLQSKPFNRLTQLKVKRAFGQVLSSMSTSEYLLLWIGWFYNLLPSFKLFSQQWMKWDRSRLNFTFDGWYDQDYRSGCDVLPSKRQSLWNSGIGSSKQWSQDSMWAWQVIIQRIEFCSGQDPRSIEAIDLHMWLPRYRRGQSQTATSSSIT